MRVMKEGGLERGIPAARETAPITAPAGEPEGGKVGLHCHLDVTALTGVAAMGSRFLLEVLDAMLKDLGVWKFLHVLLLANFKCSFAARGRDWLPDKNRNKPITDFGCIEALACLVSSFWL